MRLLTTLSLFSACVAAIFASSHAAPATYPPAQTTGAAVVVPYYGATYGQPGGFSQADAKRMLELQEQSLEEQKLTNEYLRALVVKQGAPLPLAGQRKPLDLLAVAKKHCAECHTPKSAKGDFILFADDAATLLKPLSANEKKRITDEVKGGTMPKGRPKMGADEKAAFKW